MATTKLDHDIEQFWFSLKVSMINFYATKDFTRPIESWSENLNKYQANCDYKSIEKYIIYYISLYANDLMRTHSNYNINILDTNIKRWDKISIKYKIFCNEKNSYINLSFVLFDIYLLLIKKDKTTNYFKLFEEMELFLIYNNFAHLIIYSVDNNCPSIIDRLLDYNKEIFSQIMEIYNLNNKVNYPISGRKIFKIIRDVQ
mgnify:CR=1 FL=1